MSRNEKTSPSNAPELTVVIPLFDKRVEEEECLESWCRAQTLSRESYEVIVTSNGTNRDAEGRVQAFLSEPDRLITIEEANMAGLYHAGAEAASAPLIFFTELHCVAERECLQELVKYLAENDCAGAFTSSYGDYSNPFSSVEAQLFDALFERWKEKGASDKILLRGVVIRRSCYFEAGGFVPRYRRFCDSLLGARLEDLGHEIHYAPKARLLHYYSTRYSQLLEPVREKTYDECLFRSENPAEFCESHWGTPLHWSLRQSLNPELARLAVRCYERSLLFYPKARVNAETLREWLYWKTIGICGVYPALFVAGLRLVRQAVKCWLGKGDQQRLLELYAPTFYSIESFFRLRFIQKRIHPVKVEPATGTRFSLSVEEEDHLSGFGVREQFGHHTFRWTRGVSLLRIDLARGNYRVHVDTGGIRGNPADYFWNIYFCEKALEDVTFDLKGGVDAFISQDAFPDRGD